MDSSLFQRLNTMQLSTQQLRLRNLTKIEGVNFVAGGGRSEIGFIYYTLHYDKDTAPFYTSEALPQHIQQKWAEINCSEILKSNKNCVCIKVWLKQQTTPIQPGRRATTKRQQINASYSTLDTINDEHSLLTNQSQSLSDTLLLCWGVYFSGLAMLTQKTDIEFDKNTLIFQMNGVDFTSADYFFTSKASEEPSTMYQRGTASKSTANICTPESFSINSPRISRSSSPENSIPNKSIVRHMQLYFPSNEVRCSYDLDKLLRLQEIQRQRLRTLRETAEIADDIKQLCVRCITPEQLKRRGRTVSSSYSSSKHQQQQLQYHSMGRKLSILLAEEDHIEPASLLRAQKLERELERLQFRNGLLLKEQKVLKDRVTELQCKLSTTSAQRLDLEQRLEIKKAEFEKAQILLEEQHQIHAELLQRRRNVVQNLENRRSTLCAELQEIYPIKRNEHGLYKICDIPCPSLGTYVHNPNSINSEQISPLALNVSLSYIAHLVKMISIIIDQPLRSPLTLDETWIHYYTPKFNVSNSR